MREWQNQSHVRWYCRYHIVIVPKYRQKAIFGTLRKDLGNVLRPAVGEVLDPRAVADAVAAGWTKEETQARVKFPDLGPVDVGQEYMLEYVETLNAGSLFDKLTSRQAAPLPPRS
jgi:hypothetical protein